MHRYWVHTVFCCWIYSISAIINMIPVSVMEVTTPNVSFPSLVATMLSHASNPRVLVITDRYSVWTLDLVNLNKTLIAGSSVTSGYKEGVSSAARFNGLYASAEFDQATVLVADYSNHCLRTVGLLSGSTQSYAGVCESDGSNDGDRASARFGFPSAMEKMGSTFYITDYKNKRIRKLDSDNVSSHVFLSNNPGGGLSWNGDKLLYSFQHGVGDSQDAIITGSSLSGFSDGSLNSARFTEPWDVLAADSQVVWVADYGNKAIRLANLSKQTVSTLDITNNRWENPFSLRIVDGSVYAGTDMGRIFKLSLNEIPGSTGKPSVSPSSIGSIAALIWWSI